jgi:hypothetical protein
MKRTVEGRVHYTGAMAERPRYYANDHSRDVLALEERTLITTSGELSPRRHRMYRSRFATRAVCCTTT